MVTPEDRIRELSANLRPVRPIPSLASVISIATLAWMVAVAMDWALGQYDARVFRESVGAEPGYASILIGLILLASGSIVAAVAGAVPGRELPARVGGAVGLLGLVLALASGIGSVDWSTLELGRSQLLACLSCFSHAGLLGFVSTAIGCGFVGWAATRRFGIGAAWAISGGIALGAVAVHLTCAALDPMHRLVSHALAPIVAALLFAPVVGTFLRRHRDRSGQREPA